MPFILLIFVVIPVVAVLLRAGWTVVPASKVGIVTRRYTRRSAGQFRIRTDGSPGVQAGTLPPNTRCWLAPLLNEVELVDEIFVPDGTIGLVEAAAGAVRPPNRRLSTYVECDHFQDGAAFLSNGGEQGRQLGILPGGARYSINTKLFTVITVDTIDADRHHGLTVDQLKEIEILEGNAGVVIVSDGLPPADEENTTGRLVPGHEYFSLPWVFLANGGQRGVQQQTLPGGTRYAISPWFAKVVLVPTRDLLLEWTKKENKSSNNLDSALDQIVVDVEGHKLSLEMSQILRIPAEAAPRLVRRFGEQDADFVDVGAVSIKPAPVQRFVERVLGAAVAGYFTALVGKYTILRFIEEYDEVRLLLQDLVTQALRDWDVVAGQTVLGEFTSEDREVNDMRRKIASTREAQPLLEQELANALTQQKIHMIEIETEGSRQVSRLRAEIDALGPQHVAVERISAQLAKMNVPQFISGGSGDIADQLLRMMPLTKAQDMLRAVFEGASTPQPTDRPAQIEVPDDTVVELPEDEPSGTSRTTGG